MSSVYLGDIDPNNRIMSPLWIRRHFMTKLLVWDSVVLSDSQILTDPRINVLMRGFDSEDLPEKLGMTDINKEQKGFEDLINHGLVKIASRKKGNVTFDLRDLYSEMCSRPNPIPFLPDSYKYSSYLDSLRMTKLIYDLDRIEHMFSNNLQGGVGTTRFPNTTRVENELVEILKNDHINFSTILEYIKEKRKDGEITQEEYYRIYEYVFSCYSINISAQTNCYLSTEFKNIPLHIDCGTGDFQENTPSERFDELPRSWALNPLILDELSFDEFIQMKTELNKIQNIDMIMKCYNGTLLNDQEYYSFYDAWEKYVFTLELYIKNILSKKKIELYREFIKLSDIRLKQRTFLTGGWEVVKSWLSQVPIIGDLLNVIDLANSSNDYIRLISHKKQWNDLVEKKDRIDNLLSPHTKIITKFKNDTD